jgi:hypothetical protein
MSACYPIIINKKNLVPGSTNQYRYNFSTNVDFSNIDIGLGSASVWFSWQNITDYKNNNKFTIIHPTSGAGNATLNITIPNGGYEITDINNYLRYYLISNGYYLRNNTTGDDTVYCELKVNPSIYAIEFVTYPLPTSLPSGFTAGPSLTFPSTTRCPQLTVSNIEFGTVIGFATGTFPTVQPTTITSVASTFTPVVSDVTNVILTLDSANNPFAQNSGVIHSISPAGYNYASLIRSDPNEIAWTPQQNGSRQSITLSLVNQDLVPIIQKDTDVTIKLLLRYRI